MSGLTDPMASATTTRSYRVKGTTGDVTTCELCGRSDLKSTVTLAVLDADGNEHDVVYYGSDCAARAAGWTHNQVKRMARTANLETAGETDRQRRAASVAAEAEFMAGFRTWLTDRYGVTGIGQVADLWGKVPDRTPFSLRCEYRDEKAQR